MVGKSLRDHLRIWKILFIRSLSISLQCLYRQWDTGILGLWQKPHLPVSLLHLFVQSTLHSLVQSRPRLPTPLRNHITDYCSVVSLTFRLIAIPISAHQKASRPRKAPIKLCKMGVCLGASDCCTAFNDNKIRTNLIKPRWN